MASVGHIAVGLAAARLHRDGRISRWSSMASWSALSMLPDLDVVGFAVGVHYGDPWGHRGATHSFVFSAAVGFAIGLAARWFKQPVLRTALFATAVVASHPLLDTMTDGGLGCALLWPFDLTRYFAPWRPIPVAPIGPAFFSFGGAIVALTELILFSPLLLFAVGRWTVAAKPRLASVFLVLWAISTWLLVSGDRVRDAIVGLVLREDTAYASGFSEKAFSSLTPGTSAGDVRQLLGAPLRETWFYPANDDPAESASDQSALATAVGCFAVRFENGVVRAALEQSACKKAEVVTGMSTIDVDRRLGTPPERCWQYSWSPGRSRFRLRAVCFAKETVSMVIRQWDQERE